MTEITDEKLIEWSFRGIIPGPQESNEEFLQRAHKLQPVFKEKLPALDKIHDLFTVKPDWIGIDFSNKGLLPWQGGCVTIEDENISLQVRKGMRKKKKIWGIYTQDEIIAHELVHVARGAFVEPIFEEIIAYHTSPSKFRKFFGPLFRSSKESILFLATIAGLTTVNLLYILPLTLITGCVGIATLFLFRLHRNQKTFSKMMNNLHTLFRCEKKALACALRLTDREIITFASKKPEEIHEYAKSQRATSLRWRQLYLTTFNHVE